jgi:hypothetical protein
MQYCLRTLLIVLALGPPMFAGGYWTWDAYRPKPSPWYIQDGGNYYMPPGPDWKLSREAVALKQFKADMEAEQAALIGQQLKLVTPKVILGEEGHVGPIEIPEP